MLIFANEERAYLSWVGHHHQGFVLDWLKKPTRKQPVLHRATCERIRKSTGRKTHWTTGRHVKACSLDAEELIAWATYELETSAVPCDECDPLGSPASEEEDRGRLTKLEKQVLDYLLEVAVIHMDQKTTLVVTVNDVAEYFRKTPGQINATLVHLIEKGYLGMEGTVDLGAPLAHQTHLFPRARAMRTLPAFEEMSPQQLSAELRRLTEPPGKSDDSRP